MDWDIKNTGLVLEGGGMRGVFTCGVLDYFMEQGIEFPYAIGVSAGACNGLSYLSHQKGRAKYSNIDLLDKYHYIGLKYLWYQHSILDQRLLYELFPEEILPYDYEAYFRNPTRFEMVTTNCVTGRACYLEEKKDKFRGQCTAHPVIPGCREAYHKPYQILSQWHSYKRLQDWN